MEAFWEPGGVIFLCFFGCVFLTTPGATPDRQRGVPGVLDTDRPSKREDNFGGLGPRGGGATMIYRTSNKDNQQSQDLTRPGPEGRRIIGVVIVVVVVAVVVVVVAAFAVEV